MSLLTNCGNEIGPSSAPLIIGADGIHSTFRQCVINDITEQQNAAIGAGGGGSAGGSGGGGGGGPRSLSGLMNRNAAIGAGGGVVGNEGTGFAEGIADGYTWSQNNEEVELRFPVSSGTKAKYVKVNFGRSKLKVVVAGQTLLNGSLGGTVQVDDTIFTIEDASSGTGRELCVTLGKSIQDE